jgi:hypothetical protein
VDVADIGNAFFLALLGLAFRYRELAEHDRSEPLVAHERRMLQRLDDLKPVVQPAEIVLAQREVAFERFRVNVLPEPLDKSGDRLEAVGEAG